jgi:hypothetical protein
MSDPASLVIETITAVGVLLTGLGTYRATKKVEAVHHELKTTNNHTVGELVEQNLPPSFGDQVASDEPRGPQTEPSRSTKDLLAGQIKHPDDPLR